MRLSFKEEKIKFKGFRKVKTVTLNIPSRLSGEKSEHKQAGRSGDDLLIGAGRGLQSSKNNPSSFQQVYYYLTAKISPVCGKALPALNTSLWVC